MCIKPRPGAEAVEQADDVQSMQHSQQLVYQILDRLEAATESVARQKRDNGLYCIAERCAGDVLGARPRLVLSSVDMMFHMPLAQGACAQCSLVLAGSFDDQLF